MAIEEVLNVTSKSDTGGVDDATKAVEKLEGAVGDLGPTGKKALSGVIDSLKKLPSIAGDAFGNIKSAGTGAFNGIKSAIGALPGALGVFNQAFEGVMKIKDMLGGLFETLKERSPEFAQAFLGVQDSLNQIVGPLLDKLATAFVPILNRVMEVLRDPAVQRFIDAVGTLMVKALDQVVKFIDTVLLPAINVIVPILTDVLNGDWEAAWNKMLDFVRNIDWAAVINGIVNAIKSAWDVIKDVFAAPVAAASNSIVMILLIIEKALTDVVNGIIDSVNGMINGVNNAIGGINQGLGTQIGTIGTLPRIKPRTIIFGTNGAFAYSMAEGAIAMKPTLAVVGDTKNGSPEVVAPLDKLKDMLGGVGGVVVNVYGPFGAGYTPAQAGSEAGDGFIKAVRAKGYRV